MPAREPRPVVLDRLRVRLARALERLNPQGAENALDEVFASAPRSPSGLLQRDPVAAAIEVDALVFTPAG
jgi:hypothetical protein